MKNSKITIVFVFMSLLSFAQPFGNDVIVDNNGNRRKIELAAASNGWIYEASYSQNLAGNFNELSINRSTDGGLNWTNVISIIESINVVDFDLLVVGIAAGDLRINMIVSYTDLSNGLHKVAVKRYDGISGTLISTPWSRSDAVTTYGSVSIAADNLFASSTGTSTVSVAYAISALAADSIMVITSENGGLSYTTGGYAAFSSNYFGDIHLDYGRCATHTFARFFLIYEQLPTPTSNTGNIYYTNQQIGWGIGWLPAVNLTDTPELSGMCRNPRIAVQRSLTDNSSGSNTVVIMAEHDPSGSGAESHIVGFVNSAPHTTNVWARLDITATTNYEFAADIDYDYVQERFIGTHYNATVGSIEVESISRNIFPVDSWLGIASNINDLAINTLAPSTRIVHVPQMNRIGIGWIEENGANGEIHYDQQGLINSASLGHLTNAQFEISPNPTSETLTISWDEATSAHVVITDLNGNEVLSEQMNEEKELQLTVSFLASGTYFIYINNNSNAQRIKFIKH